MLWSPPAHDIHYIWGYYDYNPYTGYYSCYCLDQDLSDVCIFLPHTILLRTLAKHNYRISYSGNLTQYTDDIGANACGLPLLDDSAMISKSLFDHGLKGNTSSVCGHKIWVQGYGNDGTTVKGASLTLTVIGYCKCTLLRQPCDRDRKFD